MKSRKGVELTLNTIIVAILGLIVLVVLILIFTGQLGRIIPTLESCELRAQDENGYRCVSEKQQCADLGGKIDYSGRCENKNDYCCILNMDTKL